MSEKFVRILLFASIREKVGKSSLDIKLDNEMNLKDFFKFLKNIHAELDYIIDKIEKKELLPYLIVLNGLQINLKDEITIFPGSELAILPPVGGG